MATSNAKTTTKASTKAQGEPAARIINFRSESAGGLKWDIIGLEEIPLPRVLLNELNPRPNFQMTQGDASLVSLGDSIKTQGQHRPCYAYEIVGHYRDADQPGMYRLLQGHRRRDACQLAGVGTLKCLLVPTPSSEAEEYTWLGIEESHKLDWQPFFTLRFASELARRHGIPVRHPDIASLTGLSLNDLRLAEKLSMLEPPIQAMVAEYEELMYESKVAGVRKKHQRISALTGVRTGEFTPAKAGYVWDIFEALRTHCTLTVAKHSDLELQHHIAAWATKGKASVSHYEDFLGLIKVQSKTAMPGFLTELDNLLSSVDPPPLERVIRGQGHGEVRRIDKINGACKTIEDLVKPILRSSDQIGNDIDRLRVIEVRVYRTLRFLNDLADSLSKRIERLEKDADR